MLKPPSKRRITEQLAILTELDTKSPIDYAVIGVLLAPSIDAAWQLIHRRYTGATLLAARQAIEWLRGETEQTPVEFLGIDTSKRPITLPPGFMGNVWLGAFVFCLISYLAYIIYWSRSIG